MFAKVANGMALVEHAPHLWAQSERVRCNTCKRYKDWSASNHATGGPPNKAHARRCRQDQIAANASVNRLYTKRVGTKLSIANRYLRNPEVRERTVAKSVATSSAIEGIRAPFAGGAKTGASSKNRLKRKRP